jgi:hypothetical protein
MGFDPCNRSLKIRESIETSIPQVGAHLGVWGLILSLSCTPESISRASLLFRILTSPYFNHEPKARATTNILIKKWVSVALCDNSGLAQPPPPPPSHPHLSFEGPSQSERMVGDGQHNGTRETLHCYVQENKRNKCRTELDLEAGGVGGELSTFIIKLSLKWNPVGPHFHHLFLISSPKLCCVIHKVSK